MGLSTRFGLALIAPYWLPIRERGSTPMQSLGSSHVIFSFCNSSKYENGIRSPSMANVVICERDLSRQHWRRLKRSLFLLVCQLTLGLAKNIIKSPKLAIYHQRFVTIVLSIECCINQLCLNFIVHHFHQS